MRTGSALAGTRGFAYVALLILLAVLAVVSAGSLSFGASLERRAAERELLALGLEFQRALHSYAAIPAGSPAQPGARGPRELEDLLRDPRAAGLRRHLRQIPADPLTGRLAWGLVVDGQGAIVGVHSLAPGRPLQRQSFDPALRGFEEAESYDQWVFGLPGASGAAPPGRAAPR